MEVLVAVELVATVYPAERGENAIDLVGRDFVELVALVRLYPVKAEGETLEVEAEVRVTQREGVEGMRASDRYEEN